MIRSDLDSLKNDIKSLKEENKDLKAKLATAKIKWKEYFESDEISKKDILKNENNELVKKVELLTREKNEINKQITEQKKIIEDEQNKRNLYGKEERERGKEEIYKRIAEKYEKPFDTLVNLLTFNIVKLDTSILAGHDYNKQICIDVLNYFEAERVLSEKFDEQGVKKALEMLSNIKQDSIAIKELADKIYSYNKKNEALKVLIEDIKKIDSRLTANDEDTEDLKKAEIFRRIYLYFYKNKYNLTDYPYITKVILKIINMKERDANQSISKLLDEL
jgi:hypothetical protein